MSRPGGSPFDSLRSLRIRGAQPLFRGSSSAQRVSRGSSSAKRVSRPGPVRTLGLTALGLTALALTGCAPPPAPEAGIRATLEAFPPAFAARDADAACGLFTDDAVLVYPGTPDRTHDEFCAQLAERFADPSTTVAYDPPEIQEISVSGSMASVRLVWTSTVTKDGKLLEHVREQGLDVFRLDPDGVWRIRISQAFPLDSAAG